MQMLIKDRLAFLAQLDEAKKPKVNKTNKAYIDFFLVNNYTDIVTDLSWCFNFITDAMDKLDRLNEFFLKMYYVDSVKFKNQSECDTYIIGRLRESKLYY